jgi:hypothetical protein
MYSKLSIVVVVKPCSQWVAYGPPKKKKQKQKQKRPQVIETSGWHVAYGPQQNEKTTKKDHKL